MHISEGILSAPVLVSGVVAAIAGTGIGLKKTDYEGIVNAAIITSGFFVVSLIHVNIGPVSTHLVLNGIIGLILGFTAFPAILIALALQAVYFGYGGLSTLGINTVVIALPAVLSHYLFLPVLGKKTLINFIAGFFAGMFCIFFSSVLMGLAFWVSDNEFFVISLTIISANIIVMIIEGIITGFCVVFLLKVFPQIIIKRKTLD